MISLGASHFNPTAIINMVAATTVLSVGVWDDLRSKKFHNWLFLACSFFALVVAFANGGSWGVLNGAIGFTASFALLMPLVLTHVIGAGDMKLLAAFGIVMGWNAVFTVAIAAFVWGAVFGVVRTAVRGELKGLVANLVMITTTRQSRGLELQTMPFTVAIFMGWLTHLVLDGVLK